MRVLCECICWSFCVNLFGFIIQVVPSVSRRQFVSLSVENFNNHHKINPLTSRRQLLHFVFTLLHENIIYLSTCVVMANPNPAPLMSFVEFVKSEAEVGGKYPNSSSFPVPPLQLKIAKLSYDLHEEIRKCSENSTISKRLREELER